MISLAAPRQVSLFFSDMAGFTSLSVLQAFIRWQVYTVVDVCCKSHRNEFLYVSAQNLWLMMENDVTGVIAQSCCKSSPCCEIMLSNGVHFNCHSMNMSFLLSLSLSDHVGLCSLVQRSWCSCLHAFSTNKVLWSSWFRSRH